MLKLLQGFAIDDEAFAKDAYLETGPGENFLTTSHTLRNYTKANFEPQIPDAGPYETWKENGALTSDQRAAERWKLLLCEYQPPEMNMKIRMELEDFVTRRKAEMSDEWY
jgi:trimethylamine--corrinoid protein Co-methyltransferase